MLDCVDIGFRHSDYHHVRLCFGHQRQNFIRWSIHPGSFPSVIVCFRVHGATLCLRVTIPLPAFRSIVRVIRTHVALSQQVARSVGVEYGAVVGIMYALAQIVTIALNDVGFAESVVNLYPHPFTGYASREHNESAQLTHTK